MNDLAHWLDHQLQESAPEATLSRSFGGRNVLLRGDDFEELQQISWALGEASAIERKPSVELRVLGEVLRTAPIPDENAVGPYGVVLTLEGTGWRACVDVDEGRLLAYHAASRVALSAALIPEAPRHRSEFGRTLLHWLATDDGNLVVHAGAVGRAGKAILFIGPGGAGKSTFVRVAVGAGATFLGDNALEVSFEGKGVATWGVYGSLKVRPPLVLPDAVALGNARHDADIGKDLYDMAAYASLGEPHAACSLVALSADGPRELTPLGRGAALFALGPSTMVQFPLYGPEVFVACGQLVRSLDCWSLGQLDTVEDHGRILERLLG